MEYNLPHRISDEKDLKYYEQYIESENKMLKPACSEPLICENKRNIQNGIKIIDKNSSLHKEIHRHDMLHWNDYLKNHIGKLLKVESLVCEKLESRVGILMEVAHDFLVIKPNRNCCSMVIGSATIKYITIMHNNRLG